MYEHLAGIKSEHAGRKSVRGLLGSFEIEGLDGRHVCLVHEAYGKSMFEMKEFADAGVFNVDMIRETLRSVLRALQFLHEEAHIVHTGKHFLSAEIIRKLTVLKTSNWTMCSSASTTTPLLPSSSD